MPNAEKAHYIIKKVKRIQGGGHHGGAWKIAYADFVTAMMAFFLLMWLLNSTSSDTKKGIAEYFDPTAKIQGQTFGPDRLSGDAINIKDRKDTHMPASRSSSVYPIQTGSDEKSKLLDKNKQMISPAAGKKSNAKSQKKHKKVKEQIEKAIQSNPEIQQYLKNLMIDETSEGLRIQLIDSNEQGMFPSGSAVLYQQIRKVIAEIASAISEVDNKITISGHTDYSSFGLDAPYTNWELSADRANAARKALVEFGVDPQRIDSVIAKESTDLLDKSDPKAPNNRRITILLLNEDKNVE